MTGARRWLVINECCNTSLTCGSIHLLNCRFSQAINPYFDGGFEFEGVLSTIYGC